MLTETQLEILNNWDEEHEGRKKHVRKTLKDSVSIFPLLRKLPPDEVREIVQSAILDYAEMDEKSELSKNDQTIFNKQIEERLIIHNRYNDKFVKESVAVLFNSVPEKEFKKGVKKGIEDTVNWWESIDRADEKYLFDNIGSDYPKGSLQIPNEVYTNRTVSLSESPEPAGEKIDLKHTNRPTESKIPNRESLACIFYLQSREDLIEPKLLDVFVNIDIFDTDIDEVEQHIKEGKYDAWIDDSIKKSPNARDNRITQSIIEAKKTINNSRYFAEKVAYYLDNPKNKAFNPALCEFPKNNPPYLKWFMREVIELHRDYLQNKGILPNESKILEYPEIKKGAPEPSKLGIKWK